MSMSPTRILTRSAIRSDAVALAAIYNQGIEDRIATFETRLRTPEDVEQALFSRPARYPSVVAEADGAVRAVAWCSEYRSRQCYEGVAEFSVYTERAFRGRGFGHAVMAALLQAAADQGFWKLVSRVFPENAGSRRLLAGLGFREVGIYRRHGRLDGQWKDCVIVEKLI